MPITFDGEAAIAAPPRIPVIFSRDLSRRVCIELHPHQPGKSPDLAKPICKPVPAASEAKRLARDLSGSGYGNRGDDLKKYQ